MTGPADKIFKMQTPLCAAKRMPHYSDALRSDNLPKTLAVVRVATSVFFLLFGEYKVFGSAFAHGGFQQYLQGWLQQGVIGLYRPVLANLVLPHAVFFGYLVGVIELFIGICLLTGLWVRLASVIGALHMVSLTMATWWEPGHGVPFWRYFGAELDHLPLLFLFLIFFVADAGQKWGLDGYLRGQRRLGARAGF